MAVLPPRKKRKITPPVESDEEGFSALESDDQNHAQNNFPREAAHWDIEQDYEQRPRKQKNPKESSRLPIKTRDGVIQHLDIPIEPENESLSPFEEESETEDENIKPEDEPENELSLREQILQAKEELAKIAGLVNENPEEHCGSLRVLAQITSSKNPTVTKLGLVTQLAVYKDVIPGYRIRPVAEAEMKIKLSKEVRQLRNFEQSVVGGYHKYVTELARISRLRRDKTSKEAAALSSVAFSCACNLLVAVPHFNFRTDLLKLVMNKLSLKRVDEDFERGLQAIEALFTNDDEGNASLEAVAMLTKMIKLKNYVVNERVLNLFLNLRLLTEFSHKGSTTAIDKSNSDESDPRNKKFKKEFWNKKKRKIAKERKAIEKEMVEADAVVSHEQRDQMQAETLKLVFSVYFRILKVRTPSLMGAVLEGLVKYAHLINQDFFGDILEALKELILESEVSASADMDPDDELQHPNPDMDDIPRNLTRESLLCVITAFALLQGQDAASAATTLNLDLSFFISHLYRTLHAAAANADIELSAKSLHLPDPHSDSANAARPKVNNSTTIVLLLRSLHAVLLPSHARSVPPLRIAAFTKQIMTCSTQMPEKSTTAILGLVAQILKVHRKKIAALWDTEERKGDGVFDALRVEVEGSNPFAATIWEGELLKHHYAPAVREGVANLELMLKEA